ncbi:MAG: zinc ribbon domain-containing protein, partial [Candidatus Hodarchaeota archaeon]
VMKKGYRILLIIVILIGALLNIYPFVPSDLQIVLLVVIISIPVIVISLFFLYMWITQVGERYANPPESEDYHNPLIQDRRSFLEHQPLICDKCNAFTDTLREYCESCGAKNSFRKAIELDFERYIKKKETKIKDEDLQPIPSLLEKEKRSFQRLHRFICDYCDNFSFRNRGYCEICGTKFSLRRARKSDFENYFEKQQQDIQLQLKEQISSSKPINDVALAKIEESKIPPTILEEKEVDTEWKERLDKPEKVSTPPEIPVTLDEQEEKPEVISPSEVPAIPPKIEEISEESIPSEISPILNEKEEKHEVLMPSEIQTIPPKIEEKPKVSILSEISPIPEKKERNCKFCGKELVPEKSFCPQCGYIINNK